MRPTSHHKPQVQAHRLPWQGHLPSCERQSPFHWNLSNGTLGKMRPSSRTRPGPHPASTGSLLQGRPGRSVNQHHLCKSPLCIVHRSDGLTRCVLLFPEANNPFTHWFLPIFPLDVHHKALHTACFQGLFIW